MVSADHTKWVIEPPLLLDWLGFIGGIAVLCFLVGKIVNYIFFRKKYVSPMMDQLFQVQDVSKIDNVKKERFTNKAVNEPTNQYKSPPNRYGRGRGRGGLWQSTPSSIRPIKEEDEENHGSKTELDMYVAELGKDSADFSAFRKLVNNRKSLNLFRRGRCIRFLCCRRQNFDIMM